MSDIYWLTRMGVLGDACTILCIAGLCVICFCLCVFPLMVDVYKDLNEGCQRKLTKVFKVFCVVWVLSVIGYFFIPSKKDMLTIYGIGSTIDYVKSNDKAKQLPDKCIDAITRYVDSIEKENEDNNK